MDVRAWPMLVLLVLAGCSSESTPEPDVQVHDSPTGGEGNQTVTSDQNASEALPAVNATVDASEFWIGMDGCMEYDFQAPIVDKAPDDSWYPDGGSPVFIVPGTASYAFFLLECEQILVDNRTLYEDGHYVVVEAGVSLPEDHPYSASTDQLHVQAFTDIPEIQKRMAAQGFRVELANFSYTADAAKDTWAFSSQRAAVEFTALEPRTDGGIGFDADARLHSVSQIDSKHIFYDFLRNADPEGFQQDTPRLAVGVVPGVEIEGPSGHLVGTYSEHAMAIDLRVPVWI